MVFLDCEKWSNLQRICTSLWKRKIVLQQTQAGVIWFDHYSSFSGLKQDVEFANFADSYYDFENEI